MCSSDLTDEVRSIKNSLNGKNLLIGEFNTLASPTDTRVREELESLFGIRWSGWTGRFFQDLSNGNSEIPDWLIKNYETRYGVKWNFTGAGFALIDVADRVLILKQGQEVGRNLNRIVFTDEALAEFKVKNNVRYHYWFDIIEPEEKTEVLAWYELDVTEAGNKRLEELGLSRTFPAIARSNSPSRTYYFAGDFADNNHLPTFWQSSHLKAIYGLFAFNSDNSQNNFFWNVYYPFMEKILSETTG